MNRLATGTIETLTVSRLIDSGYVLAKDGEEALLHHNETDKKLEPGNEVEVFLYNDKKGNIAATTQLPHIVMDEYGWADVIEVLPHLGAFVSIGTTKDMLVSKDDLPLFESVWPKPEDRLFVTLGRDQKGKLLAIPAKEGAVAREVDAAPEELLHKQVKGTVYLTDKQGSAMITTENHRAFIHYTERKQEPRLGEFVEGRVIAVKDDGSINVSLLPLKQESMHTDAEAILAHLEASGGTIPFSDKSDPEDIRGTFNISKAAFKRALGKLLKEGKIEQRDGNTYLIER